MAIGPPPHQRLPQDQQRLAPGSAGVQTRQVIEAGSTLVDQQCLTQNRAQGVTVNLPGLNPQEPLNITVQFRPHNRIARNTDPQPTIFTFRDSLRMHIEFELNQNDLDALLQHCHSFSAASGDSREDRRLEDALEALKEALLAANASR